MGLLDHLRYGRPIQSDDELMSKKLLFSVTKDDCEWSYTRGTGSGGQKKNKTNSACHCTHRASGAHGYAEDSRSQQENRKTAFERMAATKTFQEWLKLESMRRSGAQAAMEDEVQRQLKKVRIDVKDEHGRWVQVDKDAVLPDELDN